MPTGAELPGWIVLLLPLPASGREYLLVDALHRLGAHTVERDEDQVVARVPVREDPAAFVARARGVLHSVDPRAASGMRWRAGSADEPFRAWSRDARARRVGTRIRLAPLLEESSPEKVVSSRRGPGRLRREDELVVWLAPGTAFGTGDHPTTRGCLRLMEPLSLDGSRVGDVGAGSGILTVAAVLLGADFVVAMEADPTSCDTLRRNLRVNGISCRTDIVCTTVQPGILASLGPFDGVVANLGTESVETLLPAISGAIRPGGWAILSGIPALERFRPLRRARTLDMVLEAEDVETGWWTGHFRPGEPPLLPPPERRRVDPPPVSPPPAAPEPG